MCVVEQYHRDGCTFSGSLRLKVFNPSPLVRDFRRRSYNNCRGHRGHAHHSNYMHNSISKALRRQARRDCQPRATAAIQTTVTSCCWVAATVVLAATNAGEKAALLELYTSTRGTSWVLGGWSAVTDPCINGWYGVTCSSNGANVA